MTLDKLYEILPNNIGPKIEQFKLEHLLEEAYFISNKTYLLLTNEGKTVKKS